MGEEQFKIKVSSRRSFLFTAKWWQFRQRYYIWKLKRRMRSPLAANSPEQKALEKLHQDLEREILFGKAEDDHPYSS